ncbi:MMPL family transporter [Streptomyces sp. NPDC048332]|uniref:MMPL family transporter n=1 Tax=Streptomyces sp. NPDC048332 TaxID=3154619 RepID=UPI00341E6A9F
MATFLYRLGRNAFRRRGYVALLWLAVLAAVGLGALQAPGASSSDESMPGIESQQAYDLIQERFPGATADSAGATVVFVAPDGQKVTASDNRQAIEETVDALGGGAQVAGVADPFTSDAVSKDGSTAYTSVAYKVASDDVTDASRTAVEDAAEQAREAGLTVDLGGSAMEADDGLSGVAEIVGISVAALVLLVTFGSLAAAGLPLLTAIVGVAMSLFAIMLLAGPLGLSSDASTLGMMLGLAVGIDYALFIVSRFREERGKGHAPEEAAGLAVGTAGSSVVFAGLTVIIALAGLAVVGVPSLTQMGLAAAGAVLIAVLAALTFVPALLGFWPNAVLSRRARKGLDRDLQAGPHEQVTSEAPEQGRANLGTRWARFVLRRPLPVLILGVLGLGVLAVPAASLQLGMPGDEALSTSTTQRRAYDELAEGFGPGFNGPLTVVVDAQGASDPKTAVATISEKIAGTDGVVSVSSFDDGERADHDLHAARARLSDQSHHLLFAGEQLRESLTVEDQRPPHDSACGGPLGLLGEHLVEDLPRPLASRLGDRPLAVSSSARYSSRTCPRRSRSLASAMNAENSRLPTRARITSAVPSAATDSPASPDLPRCCTSPLPYPDCVKRVGKAPRPGSARTPEARRRRGRLLSRPPSAPGGPASESQHGHPIPSQHDPSTSGRPAVMTGDEGAPIPAPPQHGKNQGPDHEESDPP